MTMRNDAAWHAGHETARPYLLAVAWVGILGIVATVVAVVTGGLSLGDPMAVAASIVILGLQGGVGGRRGSVGDHGGAVLLTWWGGHSCPSSPDPRLLVLYVRGEVFVFGDIHGIKVSGILLGFSMADVALDRLTESLLDELTEVFSAACEKALEIVGP